MKLDNALLGLLAVDRMSGYDIKKWLTVEGQFLGLDRHASQIYRQLNKMQVDGWIDFEVDVRTGGPDAKVYRLSPVGLERLRRWIQSPYEPASRFQAPEFALRLLFTAMLDVRRAGDLVEQELDFRVLQVMRNRDRDRTLRSEHPSPGVDVTRLQFVNDRLHDHGRVAIDAYIEWLRTLLVQLREQAELTEEASR